MLIINLREMGRKVFETSNIGIVINGKNLIIGIGYGSLHFITASFIRIGLILLGLLLLFSGGILIIILILLHNAFFLFLLLFFLLLFPLFVVLRLTSLVRVVISLLLDQLVDAQHAFVQL